MAAIASVAGAPKSLSFCQGRYYSYIFYVLPKGDLGYLRGPLNLKETGDGDPPQFTPRTLIDKSGNPVTPKSNQVAAIAFNLQSEGPVLRVYYVNQKGYLNELCAKETKEEGAGPFSPGSLNKSNIKAAPDSVLDASADEQGQTKIIYQNESNDVLYGAWVTTGGTEGWKQSVLNNRY